MFNVILEIKALDISTTLFGISTHPGPLLFIFLENTVEKPNKNVMQWSYDIQLKEGSEAVLPISKLNYTFFGYSDPENAFSDKGKN